MLSVSEVATTSVELSLLLNIVVPVWLVELSEAVKVFKVDCTLPLPFNSNAILEFVVKGEPEELVIVFPFVSSIIFYEQHYHLKLNYQKYYLLI